MLTKLKDESNAAAAAECVWCAGCQFSDFAGESVIDIGRGETAAMHGCEFSGNNATVAVIDAEARAIGAGARASIEKCSFHDNTTPYLLQAYSWGEGNSPDALFHVNPKK